MKLLRRIALWWVMDGPKMPNNWAPHVFGFALGCKPEKVYEKENKDEI